MREIKVNLDKNIQIIEEDGIKYKVSIQAMKDEDCICGCGNKSAPNSMYFKSACRTRVYRRKKFDKLKI